MFDSDVLFYLIVLLVVAPVSLWMSWKYKYDESNKTRTLVRILFVLLNLNIVYFLIHAITDEKKFLFEDDYNLITPVDSDIFRVSDDGFSPIGIVGYRFTNSEQNPDISCDKILNDDVSEIQVSQKIDLNKENDLKLLRTQLNSLRNDNPVYDLFFQDGENEDEKTILKTKWYKFCASAVWLPKYGVYFMVNRIAYSHVRTRNNPTISVLAGQVFDKDWNEIFGMKFPFSDLEFPTILPHDIDVGIKEKKEIIGSEDPRIILHEYINQEGITIQEPLITFNALNQQINWKRGMHIYRPLYDAKKVTLLSIENLEPREKEKNWVPFEIKDNHIHFIYSFPLRVIKCNLDTGICQKTSGPSFEDDSKSNAGALRGGTNLVEIPTKHIPKDLRSRKYWFGIARSHIKHCGCVEELYRPHVVIISRRLDSSTTDDYSLVYVSDLLDFNINPEPWTEGKSTCKDGKLVLIPNSLAYFKDGHLAVTFSEADKTNKLVLTKDWLKYIQKILNDSKEILKDENRDPIADGLTLSRCSTFLSEEYCKRAKITMSWDYNFGA